jgi:hypothetical protein
MLACKCTKTQADTDSKATHIGTLLGMRMNCPQSAYTEGWTKFDLWLWFNIFRHHG